MLICLLLLLMDKLVWECIKQFSCRGVQRLLRLLASFFSDHKINSLPNKKSTCQALTGANRTARSGRSSLHSHKLCLQGYRCNYIYYTSFLYLTQVFIIQTSCEISFLHSTTTKVLKNLPVTKRYSKQLFVIIVRSAPSPRSIFYLSASSLIIYTTAFYPLPFG